MCAMLFIALSLLTSVDLVELSSAIGFRPLALLFYFPACLATPYRALARQAWRGSVRLGWAWQTTPHLASP